MIFIFLNEKLFQLINKVKVKQKKMFQVSHMFSVYAEIDINANW